MSKTRLFYDIATLILVGLGIVALITVFSGPVVSSFDQTKSLMLSSMRWFAIFYLYSVIYAISLIILVAMKEKGVVNAVVMIIGCLILPGILPLFYYLFFLRKKL